MASLLAGISQSDLNTLFIVLALIAFGVAIWQATQRSVLGTLLAAGVGVVLLLAAT